MDKQVLLATYENLATAEAVVESLVDMNLPRSTIGLALHGDTGRDGKALVTVTIDGSSEDAITDTMNEHNPLQIDSRKVQWRQGDDSGTQPDETAYIALPLSR